jgi:hypothetical protein
LGVGELASKLLCRRPMLNFKSKRILVPDASPPARLPKEGALIAGIGILLCATVAIAALVLLFFGA